MGNLLDLFVFKYNRTDFHELNLDWIISDVKTMAETLQSFISLNVIKYADPIQWDITKQYEANTIVIDPETGIAYLSTQPVGTGVSIGNTDYWTEIFNLSALIDAINNNLTKHPEPAGTTTSSYALEKGDWLLIGNVLYYTLTPINIGDAYVEDTNIKRTTIEERAIPVYYPDEERLEIKGKVAGSSIRIRGDYHEYDAPRQAINIYHLD